MKMKMKALTGFTAVVAFVGSANADVILSNDKIVSGTITGTMYIIDTPSSEAVNDTIPAGPDWTEDVSDGWQVLTGTRIRANSKVNTWEPDGSSTSNDISWFNGSVSFTFDLPDGTVINSIYASWQGQNDIGGADYSYSEGAASGTVGKSHEVAPDGGLVLSWIDNNAVTVNTNFEQLFAGPIVVAGGNGFTLTAIANGLNNNAPFSDAIVLDVTVVPEPGSPVSLSDFAYNPADGSSSVSIKGPPNTRYKLVEAADLDFSSPDQDPITLDGATVGTLDSGGVITDSNGDATVQFQLGTGPATFFRAEGF